MPYTQSLVGVNIMRGLGFVIHHNAMPLKPSAMRSHSITLNEAEAEGAGLISDSPAAHAPAMAASPGSPFCNELNRRGPELRAAWMGVATSLREQQQQNQNTARYSRQENAVCGVELWEVFACEQP